jgi:hypothetical protein
MSVKNTDNFFEVIGYVFFLTIILECDSIWVEEELNTVIIVFHIHDIRYSGSSKDSERTD